VQLQKDTPVELNFGNASIDSSGLITGLSDRGLILGTKIFPDYPWGVVNSQGYPLTTNKGFIFADNGIFEKYTAWRIDPSHITDTLRFGQNLLTSAELEWGRAYYYDSKWHLDSSLSQHLFIMEDSIANLPRLSAAQIAIIDAVADTALKSWNSEYHAIYLDHYMSVGSSTVGWYFWDPRIITYPDTWKEWMIDTNTTHVAYVTQSMFKNPIIQINNCGELKLLTGSTQECQLYGDYPISQIPTLSVPIVTNDGVKGMVSFGSTTFRLALSDTGWVIQTDTLVSSPDLPPLNQ